MAYFKFLMLKITIYIYIYTLSQQYLNEVHEQRRLEHPVQPHVTVGQQVGQTSSRAVFHCQGKDSSVQEETQIQVHIFMSHLPQLEMERHIETQTDTLWKSGFFVFLSDVPDGDFVTSTLTFKSIIFSLILIVKKKKRQQKALYVSENRIHFKTDTFIFIFCYHAFGPLPCCYTWLKRVWVF